MKKFYILFSLLFVLFTSCVKEEQFKNSPIGVFDACWKILDEKYCFFEYKDIDWDDVYSKYHHKIYPSMGQDSLFSVINAMMRELKDGHVNLYSSFNVGRYWEWFEEYPPNFFEHIQKRYLGTKYQIAGGMKYTILQPDSIGYIYYGSFASSTSESNLDHVLYALRNCKGIIFDVRNNGGGSLYNAEKIASRFTKEKILSGYIQHKTGKGHNDFSEPYPLHLSPSERICFYKSVAVLSNRMTYSAANNFVSLMSNFPNVKVFGDKTGGGSGMPFSSELPNGWSIRFSASPIYDSSGNHTEFGIEPDYNVEIIDIDFIDERDTIIEVARKYINNNSTN